MAANTKTDTHVLFNTVNHFHIGPYDNELCVVECENGKLFVENNWGDECFETIDGISNPHIQPYCHPQFFDTEKAACDFAVKAIKTIRSEFVWNDDED